MRTEFTGSRVKCTITLLNYLIGDVYSKSNQKEVDPDIVFRWEKGMNENVMTWGFWHWLICAKTRVRICRKFTNTESGAWTESSQVSDRTSLSLTFAPIWPGLFWLSNNICKFRAFIQQVQLAYVITVQTNASEFSEIFSVFRMKKQGSIPQEGTFHNHVLLGVGLRSLVMRTRKT